MKTINHNSMSPEIRDFSYMIDEQFEIVDNPNKGFWAFIFSFFN
nr:phenylalanyl-tRNA synthetase subunit alpha [Pseudopedobacter sp.]